MPGLFDIAPEDELIELERELALRRRLFPRWIATGTLKRDVAEHRIACIEATCDRLRKIVAPRRTQEMTDTKCAERLQKQHELIEIVARAITVVWSSHFGDGRLYDDLDDLSKMCRREEARAAVVTINASGTHKVLARRETNAMLAEGSHQRCLEHGVGDIWRAMWDAAPTTGGEQ